MRNLPVIYVKPSVKLPDNKAFTNRFEVKSETSNRIYTIAQSKSGHWWGCSCPGWIAHRHCKHLKALGLPGDHKPYTVQIKG